MKIKLPKNPEKIDFLEIKEHKIQSSFDPKTLSLWLSEEQKIGFVKGTNLQKKLPTNVANACVLEYLLDHQELIPGDWKDKPIFFWGTIYSDSGGSLYVRCLYWAGEQWDWSYSWLGYGFDDNYPAALLASSSELRPSKTSETLSFDPQKLQFSHEGKQYKIVEL